MSSRARVSWDDAARCRRALPPRAAAARTECGRCGTEPPCQTVASAARVGYLTPGRRSVFMNSRLASPLLLSCAALLLTRCPNPNTYGTPRTVAPGKVSHSIAAEWVGWSFKVVAPSDSDSDAPPAELTESGGFIVPPSYALRVGVSDRSEERRVGRE